MRPSAASNAFKSYKDTFDVSLQVLLSRMILYGRIECVQVQRRMHSKAIMTHSMCPYRFFVPHDFVGTHRMRPSAASNTFKSYKDTFDVSLQVLLSRMIL